MLKYYLIRHLINYNNILALWLVAHLLFCQAFNARSILSAFNNSFTNHQLLQEMFRLNQLSKKKKPERLLKETSNRVISEKLNTIRWLTASKGCRRIWKIATLTASRQNKYRQWGSLISMKLLDLYRPTNTNLSSQMTTEFLFRTKMKPCPLTAN